MVHLPQIKPKDLRKVLLKLGFEERPGKDSHRVYAHPDGRRTVLAIHPKPVSKGTLCAILRQTELGNNDILK